MVFKTDVSTSLDMTVKNTLDVTKDTLDMTVRSLLVISTERSEWRNLFADVSTSLDMTVKTRLT